MPEPREEPTRSYGVEAELQRLLDCPECGSSRVRQTRERFGSYGFFGLKALGELGASRQMTCRRCGHTWMRAPLRELRAEATRRIDERYEEFELENQRLLRELARDRAALQGRGEESDARRDVDARAEFLDAHTSAPTPRSDVGHGR